MEIWKRRLMDRILNFRICLLLFYSLISLQKTSGFSPKLQKFSLHFNGSEGSFAQTSHWQPTFSPTNWTFSFDFRTNISSGVLVYADDNSRRAFLQLRLISSQLECRIQTPLPTAADNQSDNGAAQPALPATGHSVAQLGHDLNDNQWHTVLIDKTANVVSVRIQSPSRGEETRERIILSSGKLWEGPVKVFFGGLPANFSTQFSELANPSVVYLPRYEGVIKAVSYTVDSLGNWPQLLKQNGVSKAVRPALCDTDELERDLLFSGKEYIRFTGLPAGQNYKSDSEVIARLSFQFRSHQSKGFLARMKRWSELNVDVLLLNDCLVVTITTTSAAKQTSLSSPCQSDTSVVFGDYSLHNVSVELRKDGSEMVVEVDGNDTYWKVALPKSLYPNAGFTEIYLGGEPTALYGRAVGAERSEGFQGSISKVIMRSGYRTRNLHDARKLVSPESGVTSSSELDSGVTYHCGSLKRSHSHIEFQFCNPSMFLAIPEPDTRKLRRVSVQIKTTEPNGLLFLYRHDESSTFTAVDMYEGAVNVYVQRTESAAGNSGSPRITVPSSRLDDGKWHNFTLTVEDSGQLTGTGVVRIDDAETEFVIALPAGRHKPPADDLPAGSVYFGGAPLANTAGHTDFWSVQLNQSFRGLLRDIRINNEPVEEEVIAGWSDDSCRPVPEERRYCDPNPCLNGGRCREGWGRFVCDCRGTIYGGETCEKVMSKMDFNGTFLMVHQVALPIVERQVTDISFRFRTSESGSILLHLVESPERSVKSRTSRPRQSGHSLFFILRNGRLVIILSMAHHHQDEPLVCEWELPVLTGDHQWHFVQFARRGPYIRISADEYNITESVGVLEGVAFSFRRLEVGGSSDLAHHTSTARTKRGKQASSHHTKRDNVLEGITKPMKGQEPHGFVGTLQGLLYDETDVFGSNQTQVVPIRKLTEEERRNGSTHSFQTSAGFLELETLQAEVKLDIKFHIRTSEANGLLLYNGKPGKDFIAVEMARGNIHFIFDLGNGAQILRSSKPGTLNDKLWHSVHISRPKRSEYSLSVDDTIYEAASPVRDKSKLDLTGKLYLGGIPKSDFALLPRSVVSRHGFMGCIRELTLNGIEPDLAQVAEQQSVSAVVRGCSESGSECRAESCSNGGKCEHQGNGVLCDCDMTSYSGAVCDDYSIAYRFGPVPGLIIYHFDPAERLDSRNDHIAFGLITTEKEAIVARVASFTSEDSIEFQIVDGHLFVIYNMGKTAHLVTDLKHRLNDGKYHVVQFERSGANASVRIDSHPAVTKEPLGAQLDVFNGISTVQIGGKLNELKQDIERAFTGVISGFVLNGIRVLDLAADNDSNIVTDGVPEIVADLAKDLKAKSLTATEEMRKANASWLDEMQHIETTHSHETVAPDNDDLITAAAPRCQEEDESCMLVDTSKSDDLIFAHYTIIKTTTETPKTSTIAPAVIASTGNAPCDDEDCDMESSGDTDSLLSARSAIARTTRVFYVSFNTTLPSAATIASSYPASPDGSILRGSNSDFDVAPRSSNGVLIPVPTISTVEAADAVSFLVQYAAIIAGIAIGIIFLVGLIVCLAVRRRSGRSGTQIGSESGKPTDTAQPRQEGGRGTSGTLRVNPRDGGGGVSSQRPPSYPGGSSRGGNTLDRSKLGTKDKEWYV